MSIGNLIKHYRKERGITQFELADAANLSRSYIGDIERDRYNPSVDTLQRIAVVLQIPVGVLIDGCSETVISEQEFNGKYNPEFNCITHRAPISILAAMYQMNSVVLSEAINVKRERAGVLLTAFGIPTEDECKKAADFFELSFEDLLSGRVLVQFNPLVQGKIYQLTLEASRRD